MAGSVLAGALAVADPAGAADPPAVWEGDLFVISATGACNPDGISAGSFYRAIYRPDIAAPPPNQAKEALSLVSLRSAFILNAPGSTLRGSVVADSVVIGGRATDSDSTAPVQLSITPAKITAKTGAVEISGSINNFFNIAGCTVNVAGILGPRLL
jgi:hypothetical protein